MNTIHRESKSFVLFDDISGRPTLYERVYNSLHDAAQDIGNLVAALNKQEISPSFKHLDLERAVSEGFHQLVLNVTEQCNLRCGYCIYSGAYEDQRDHTSARMSPESAIMATNAFLKNAKETHYVTFYGGEPLTNMQTIKAVVGYAKSRDGKPQFATTTNFTLAKSHLDFLIENDFNLTISLDGEKNVHDRWRTFPNGDGSFGIVYENVRRLSNTDREYYNKKVGFSVTIADPASLESVEKFFSDPMFASNPIRIQSIERRFLSNRPRDYELRLADGLDQLMGLASRYAENIANGKETSQFSRGLFDGIVHRVFTRDDRKMPDELVIFGMCTPGFRKLFVDTNGTYYMCEKIGRRFKLGSIDDGFDQDKAAEAYNRYAEIKTSVCKDCWAVRLCDSCAVSAKSFSSIDSEGQKKACVGFKRRILQGLAIYSFLLRNDPERHYKDYYNEIRMEDEEL